MPLPILHARGQPTRDDLLRFHNRTELHWTRHLAEEAALDSGTAFTNPQLDGVSGANCVLDAAIPEGGTAPGTFQEISSHFEAAGVRCLMWAMNPSAPSGRTAPLEAHLLANGYQRRASEVLYLNASPARPVREAGDLKIIPARASFRHVSQLAQEAGLERQQNQLAQQWQLHLDDPHCDALIALRGGRAVGYVNVLSVGDLGTIHSLFVTRDLRRQGIGRTMLSRAMEISVRSLFRHVFAAVEPGDEAAPGLYRELGFGRLGEQIRYLKQA